MTGDEHAHFCWHLTNNAKVMATSRFLADHLKTLSFTEIPKVSQAALRSVHQAIDNQA